MKNCDICRHLVGIFPSHLRQRNANEDQHGKYAMVNIDSVETVTRLLEFLNHFWSFFFSNLRLILTFKVNFLKSYEYFEQSSMTITYYHGLKE